MDFIKRLLRIETDEEWFRNAPVGFSSETIVAREGSKLYRINTNDAVLLTYQWGYTGWAVHECASSYPTSHEFYQIGKKFLSHFVRKEGSGIKAEDTIEDWSRVYEKLTDKRWHITPAGHKALTDMIAEFPAIEAL